MNSLSVKYLYCLNYGYSTVLSGNIWQELALEPKLGTKVEPEINNFGSATLIISP